MRSLVLFIACISLATPIHAAESSKLHIGQFSQQSSQGWSEKEFSGNTAYRLVTDSQRQQTVMQANSQAAASGLFYEQRIDLAKTPWLHWSWKSNAVFQGINENHKSGDDFVARIYVVIDGGMFFWNTLALNYVWSSSHQVDDVWDNPFTANATMFAVESGQSTADTWLYYQRNVRQDLSRLLGKDVRYIDAIAIMTDSDNSGQQATTFYGDIYFSSAP
ncbi:MAG: DUF3047 domain-containing protein [Mariprofundaceae bacterium]|nr:DUF3047 domain-containing protein [Mariprofundaceae bacterium]